MMNFRCTVGFCHLLQARNLDMTFSPIDLCTSSTFPGSIFPRNLFTTGFSYPLPMFIIRSFVRMRYCCCHCPPMLFTRSLVSVTIPNLCLAAGSCSSFSCTNFRCTVGFCHLLQARNLDRTFFPKDLCTSSTFPGSIPPRNPFTTGLCYPLPMFIIRSFVRMRYCCCHCPPMFFIRGLVSVTIPNLCLAAGSCSSFSCTNFRCTVGDRDTDEASGEEHRGAVTAAIPHPDEAPNDEH